MKNLYLFFLDNLSIVKKLLKNWNNLTPEIFGPLRFLTPEIFDPFTVGILIFLTQISIFFKQKAKFRKSIC